MGATLSLQSNAVLTNDGTLTGVFTLTGGAKAQGVGTFGAITVNSAGTVSPGNSGPGTLTSAAATWASGGKYFFDLDDAAGTAGTNWDLWSMTGNLSITSNSSSPFTILVTSLNSSNQPGQIADFTNASPYSWLLASTTGNISGFNATDFIVDSSPFLNAFNSGGSMFVSEGANLKNIYLNYQPGTVPEPGSLALLLSLGIVLGTGFWLRKRRTLH